MMLTVETTEVSRKTRREAMVKLINNKVNLMPITGSVLSVLNGFLASIFARGGCVLSMTPNSRMGGQENVSITCIPYVSTKVKQLCSTYIFTSSPGTKSPFVSYKMLDNT